MTNSYRRIVMAYDGSIEGRSALREGALLAKSCNAEVFLLAIIDSTYGLGLSEGVHPGGTSLVIEKNKHILEQGLERLRSIGIAASGRLIVGEAPRAIGAYAQECSADLVIVSHRRQNFLERWWSRSPSDNLIDHVSCSILVSRNTISDAVFDAAIREIADRPGIPQ